MLNSVDELIEAMGGTGAVARLAGVGPSTVSTWRKDGQIPAAHFLTIAGELGRLGVSFDRNVFGFKRETA